MLRLLLFPFAILYDLVTRVRNYQYDRGFKPSAQFEVPLISVGNLTVGGTGKTPMTEHLIRVLLPTNKMATLSRGYGRKTKGFRIATTADTPTTLGDEPFQLYRKFGHQIVVAVGEDRAFAIPLILQEHDEVEVVILDDAFQHRRVTPSLSILLSDYYRPFYNDFLLPAGRLREARSGARRADVVVITKCPPEIAEEEMMTIEQSVRRYVQKPVFFATIHYGAPTAFGNRNTPLAGKIILVTGIAHTAPLMEYLEKNYSLVHHIVFPDHHHYKAADMAQLETWVERHPDASILTTEKDWVKLTEGDCKTHTARLPLYYLPMEVSFLKNGKDFDEIVLNHVKRAV